MTFFRVSNPRKWSQILLIANLSHLAWKEIAAEDKLSLKTNIKRGERNPLKSQFVCVHTFCTEIGLIFALKYTSLIFQNLMIIVIRNFQLYIVTWRRANCKFHYILWFLYNRFYFSWWNSIFYAWNILYCIVNFGSKFT